MFARVLTLLFGIGFLANGDNPLTLALAGLFLLLALAPRRPVARAIARRRAH